MPKAKPQRLTDAEMIDILEDIARNAGNAAARISAIKTLKEISNGQQSPAEGFASLDNVVTIRRKAA